MGIADQINGKLNATVSRLIAQAETSSSHVWKELIALEFEIGHGGLRSDPMEVQRVTQAFLKNTAIISGRREIRLLASGIRTILDVPGNWMPRLEPIVQNPEISSSAWFQILSTYWDANIDDLKTKSNWIQLGSILRIHLIKWLQQNSRIAWQMELRKYPALLDETAVNDFCITNSKLGKLGLEKLFKSIGAGTGSWLYSSLILGRIRQIVDYPDQGFQLALKDAFTDVNNARERHCTIADKALAMLADRYHSGLGIHDQLRNDTIKAWGNPRLSSSDVSWAGVKADTRNMVRGWLSEWDLEQFFSLLASDPSTDAARLKYWKPYANQMTSTHIVLGTKAVMNESQDFVELRKHLINENRFSQLSGSVSNNNAFVFEINGFQFIEFGATGNALYIYEKNKAPLDLNRKVGTFLQINKLKDKTQNWMRLSHTSGWEKTFDEALQKAGVLLYGKTLAAKKRPSDAQDGKSVLDMKWLLLQFGNENIEDNRRHGGVLRIKTSAIDSFTAKKILSMGFTFTAGRGYWRT